MTRKSEIRDIYMKSRGVKYFASLVTWLEKPLNNNSKIIEKKGQRPSCSAN